MNSVNEVFSGSPMMNAIGLMLLHSIWQATAVALIIGACLHLFRFWSATCKYWLCCAGLLAMMVCPLLSLVCMSSPTESFPNELQKNGSLTQIDGIKVADKRGEREHDSESWLAKTTELVTISPSEGQHKQTTGPLGISFTPWLPMVVLIWLIGVGLNLIRLFAGLWIVNRWVKKAKHTVDSRLKLTFKRLCEQMKVGHSIQLLTSNQIDVPAATGFWRPAVLIPVSLMTDLSARELELVVAHELAHIKRYDFFVNLLQKTSEALLFYHPAVWWISNRIAIERENCCDDLAAEVCGDPVALAKALASLELVRSKTPCPALGANHGVLQQRIERLLKPRQRPGQAVIPIGLISVILAGVLFAIAFATVPAVQADVRSQNSSHVDIALSTKPATAGSRSKSEDEKKFEIRKKDSKTGIEQAVFADIKLKTLRNNDSSEASVQMKYSNIIPYTFIPEKIAKSLKATKLGAIDFENFKDAKTPTDVTWTIIPNDFANPTGFIRDGVQHYFVDFVTKPIDNPIVPYFSDAPFVPDHLGFYGMNQTRQMKFDVVRISEVDLGIGEKFGPINALVLDDQNSDFGLLGNRWAQRVRGKTGGRLLHSATGEFLIPSRKKRETKQKIRPQTEQSKNESDTKEPTGQPKSEPKVPFPENDIEIKNVLQLPNAQMICIRENGKINQVEFKSIDVRRSAAERIKHFAPILERNGGPRKGSSVTDMESIVSAFPTKRFDKFFESDEVLFNLPEGSKSRARISGENLQLIENKNSIRIILTRGSVQWIDSVGVVRAQAMPDGGAEQLVIGVKVSNEEFVFTITSQFIAPSKHPANPPVQVIMNIDTGALPTEKQPPHASIRYEVFEAVTKEEKPMRLKMKWRYDLDRLAREAQIQTGLSWDAIIWGVDEPKLDQRR